MKDNITSIALLLAIVAIILVGANITGLVAAGAPGQGGGKAANTPCARECIGMCITGASLPDSNVEDLSVDDCATQCLQARCNANVRGGQCDANAADDCCNVFAAPGQDPDCTQSPCEIAANSCNAAPSSIGTLDFAISGTETVPPYNPYSYPAGTSCWNRMPNPSYDIIMSIPASGGNEFYAKYGEFCTIVPGD